MGAEARDCHSIELWKYLFTSRASPDWVDICEQLEPSDENVWTYRCIFYTLSGQPLDEDRYILEAWGMYHYPFRGELAYRIL